MKELRCNQCSCYLGEIERGKLKNGSILFCKKCFEAYKILEDLENYKKGTAKNANNSNNSNNANNANNIDLPDGFKDIFGMK